MSGEGVIPSGLKGGARYSAGRAEEKADTLAYLRRRHANAALVESRAPQMDEFAADRRRQLEVIIGEIEAGLHVDVAETEAARMAPAAKED